MINKNKSSTNSFSALEGDPNTIAENIKKNLENMENGVEGPTTIENFNQVTNYEIDETEASNNVIVHTVDDNLIHNYFHYFDLYWDAGDPMSSLILRFPKTDQDNTKYWITYTGEVHVYIGPNVNKSSANNQEGTPATYWDMQNMKPLFAGEIGQIKEYIKELEIHVDSIGKRFKQKIPEEFRQSFINNQNVRDAFQAICEFLGVKYICPPPTEAPEDEEEETSEEAQDGTENDVSNQTNAEKQMANKATKKAAEVLKKTQSNTSSDNKTSSNNANTGEEMDNTDQLDPEALNEEEVEAPQNGYADVSFDAGGAITHASKVIETSPDMAETLMAMEEHPLMKYLTDETFVAADIKKLLSGEFFDTVHNSTMNYDAISITPKTASSSEMSSVSTPGDASGDSSGDSSENEGSSPVAGVPQPSSSAIAKHRSTSKGYTYKNGKRWLSDAYIKTLSLSHAAELAKRTNEFDPTTIKRLRRRAIGLFW
ncbi:MAG: hypothetical protein IKF82_00155 [Bacilli bacterium]|nr:hypothetical protein [Bacilli bacterium]